MSRSLIRKIVLGFLLAFLSFPLAAQTDSLCRVELKKLFDQIHALTKPETGFVGKLEYSVFIKSNLPHKPDVKEEVDLTIGNNYFSVTTQSATMVSDSLVQIVVYHPQKYILITHSQTEGMKDNKMEQLKAFQSNSIATAKEVRCTEDGYELFTTMKMNDFVVERIEYASNPGDNFFESTVIHFKENQDIDHLKLDIINFKLSEEKNKSVSVWDSIKGPTGEIKSEFENYKIVDLRKTKDGI